MKPDQVRPAWVWGLIANRVELPVPEGKGLKLAGAGFGIPAPHFANIWI
jgi:hypothetical protein